MTQMLDPEAIRQMLKISKSYLLGEKKQPSYQWWREGCSRHYQAGLGLVLSRYFKRACRVLAAFNWWPVLNSGFGKIRANVQVHQPTHSPNGYWLPSTTSLSLGG